MVPHSTIKILATVRASPLVSYSFFGSVKKKVFPTKATACVTTGYQLLSGTKVECILCCLTVFVLGAPERRQSMRSLHVHSALVIETTGRRGRRRKRGGDRGKGVMGRGKATGQEGAVAQGHLMFFRLCMLGMIAMFTSGSGALLYFAPSQSSACLSILWCLRQSASSPPRNLHGIPREHVHLLEVSHATYHLRTVCTVCVLPCAICFCAFVACSLLLR